MDITVNVPPDSTNGKLENVTSKTLDITCSDSHQSNNSLPTSSTVCKTHVYQGLYLPDDDGSILTPEHAFVQYQTRSEDQACQICGQPAVGFHHRAYVCEACKKFFMRHTAARLRNSETGSTISESICPMGGRCRVEGPGRGKCPHCRYRKCLELGMTLTPPGGEAGCDISQIPCRVCSGPSSGFHFGALTCEGCKGFFRRTVLSNVRLECLGNNDCPITPANRNMCKSCRFQRCLAVGMSKTGSRIGRQPNAIKYYCAREISQLTSSNDCEASTTTTTAPTTTTMNPSSSSLINKHESGGRNSVSHSSTNSVNGTCNINNNSHHPNSTTHHDVGNNYNTSCSSNSSHINERDLLSIAEEHCKSVLGPSNYPSSSWSSSKRFISNDPDHLDLVSTTTTTIISTTGMCLISSTVPLTTTSIVNHFIERNNNYNELLQGGHSSRNGSLFSSSPSSSTSPLSGIKNHIKYKTYKRKQYPNDPKSHLHQPLQLPPTNNQHHHSQPSLSQNNCCSNNNGSISSSTTPNNVILHSGRDSILPSSTSNGTSAGDYRSIDPSTNIVKRRKTTILSPEANMTSEISDDGSITSSKLASMNSAYIHDYDNDDDDDMEDGSDVVSHRSNNISNSNNNIESLDIRFGHRQQQQFHPHPLHPDLNNLSEENIYNVIGSISNDSEIDSSTTSISTSRYHKLTGSGKIHNMSMDNFSLLGQSRHLLHQINLPNDIDRNNNGISINSSDNNNKNNSDDRTTALQQLQFKNYPLMNNRPSGLAETPSKVPHTSAEITTTPISQSSYLRPTQLDSSTARHLSDESYSSSYLSSSTSSLSTLATASASCPNSSVISDFPEFNHHVSVDWDDQNHNDNNSNTSNQIWLPRQRYIKSNRSLSNEQTNIPLMSSNANNNHHGNNCLEQNPSGFLNGGVGGRNVFDFTTFTETEPTSTTTPWFAAAAAAVAVVMAASSSSTNSALLDPYTVSSNLNECFGINDNSNNNNNSGINQVNSRRVPVNTTNFSKQRFKLGSHETTLDHGRSFLPNSNIISYDATRVNSITDHINENMLKIGKCEPSDSALRSLHLTGPSSSSSNVTHPSTIAAMQAAAVAAAAAATAAGLVLSNSRVRGLSDDIYPNLSRVSMSNALPELPNTNYASSTSSPSPPIIGNFGRIIENLSIYSSSLDRNSQPINNLDYSSSSPSLSAAASLSSSGSTVNNFSVNHSIVNAAVPSVTTSVLSNKEASPRVKNGTRLTSITVQQFAERIQVAAKYMLSERKNIRSNLPEPNRLFTASDSVEEIWNHMMKRFETHSRFIVQFVKYIPGFCYLKISDQRQLVRSAMYPIMLLELSLDYCHEDNSRYNYFDFTSEEHAIILSHFPTFRKICCHLIRSGEFLSRLNLDNIELTLICAQEVFKDRQSLDDPVTPAYLHSLVRQVLADHIVSVGYSLDERCSSLSLISPMLEELNIEHHEIIAQLRQDRPDLEFPQLYLEMFQLTDEELGDQKPTNFNQADN
ncbi:Protein embryonic gonad [Schistosoma japonicum]|uniref:Protein embryonic gonad n=2 Tax=Schistosoma japonicum TaxID=6182 RepID=A0A4Z2CZT4_SCHJA|nr:Protein embryonic gonad [Schistosoma japonicum]